MLSRSLSIAVLAAIFLNCGANFLKDEPVSGLCDASVKSLSGYFSASEGGAKAEKNYFFWLFESRSKPSTDPLIMWLTGGPGCSSQLALLAENGPCRPTADGLGTVNNPFSWNTNANIMWIDQPAGVGYSYGLKNDHNETMVGNDMYNFLQAFFERHPEYAANEFYVFGESYGGHYAPAVASKIYNGNLKKEGAVRINLKGVGVGNGLTDPVIQYQYYPAMAMNNSYGVKTVSEETYTKMVKHLPACVKLAKACQAGLEFANMSACEEAYAYCNLVETNPYYKSGLNPYDIRVPCGDNPLCYDFSNIETFLNLESTRAALHVSPEVKTWESCNNNVNAMFMNDWMHNFQQVLVPMLEDGVRVLIYAGDVDFICNWMGNKAWTLALPWTGARAFNTRDDADWNFSKDGSVLKGGRVRHAKAVSGGGALTFLQVYEAGHMVPLDQPEAALALLSDFLGNKY